MFGVMFIFTMLVALTIVVYTDTILEQLDMDVDDFDDAQQEIINYFVDHH